MQIKMTDTGIYYLHDYIPSRKFHYYSQEEVDMSKKVWEYKEGDRDALNYFTNELFAAVSILVNIIRSDNIGLVAVPPSKVDKYSAVRESIVNMVDWCNKGLAKQQYGCNKKFYDYGKLLTRISDVNTSHTGARASYD